MPFAPHHSILIEQEPGRDVLPSGTHVSFYISDIAKPGPKCFIFLHGFPSIRSRQNLDLAEAVSKTFHANCFIPHYRGLGISPGRFFLQSSLQDARECLKKISLTFSKVHLVGHSWGGMISLNLLKEFPNLVASLTLISPLLDFKITDDSIVGLVRDVRADYPTLFTDISEEEQIADAEVIHKSHRPIVWSQDILQVPLLVFQAAADHYTPKEQTLQLLQSWGPRSQYLELPLDHSFLNDRPFFKKLFLKELSGFLSDVRQ